LFAEVLIKDIIKNFIKMYKKNLFYSVVTLLFFLASSVATHAANPNITAKRFVVSLAGGDKHFTIKSDAAWTLSSNEDWISFSQTTGGGDMDDAIVTITSSGAERQGEVIFTRNDMQIIIPVIQVNTAENYWQDGEVITLHQSSNVPAGRQPIPITIIGDGWDLGDLEKGGLWESWVRQVANLILEVDVVKDFANYFDIYAYCALSDQRGLYGHNAFGTSPYVGYNNNLIIEKIRNVVLASHPNLPEDNNDLIYILSSNGAIGGWSSGNHCGLSTPLGESNYSFWVAHEFVGHTIARIPDYYGGGQWWLDHEGTLLDDDFSFRKDSIGATYPECYVHDTGNPGTGWPHYDDEGDDPCHARGICASVANAWKTGYNWSLDWSKNPNHVVWKYFIGKPGYENVGVYDSIMRFNTLFGGLTTPEKRDAMLGSIVSFNVGSRMWIYNKILERAGVEMDNIFSVAQDHPRSVESFYNFDTTYHYNIGVDGYQTFLEAAAHPIFSKETWENNGYSPETDKNIAFIQIEPIADVPYTRGAHTPVVTFTPKILKENIDYTLSYTNNIQPGVASVEIQGMGEYLGYIIKTFNISNDINIELEETATEGLATEGLAYISINEDTEYEVQIGNAQDSSKIIIPPIYNNKPVTKISEFHRSNNLSTIIIPNGIKIINDWTFSGIYGIQTLCIPASVTNVGAWAFNGWGDNQTIYILGDPSRISDWNPIWNDNMYARIVFADQKARIVEYYPPYPMSYRSGEIEDTLHVTAELFGMNYQWYTTSAADSYEPSTAINGATSRKYVLDNTLSEGNYYYYCVVSTEEGNDTSIIMNIIVNDYTVKYVSNGDTLYLSSVTSGAFAEEYTPEQTGYIFEGWFTDNITFIHTWDFGTPITQDLILYAKWTPNPSTGIIEAKSNQLLIYPNPVDNYIYIMSSLPIEQITLYDIHGRVLQQMQLLDGKVSVTDLAKGIYLLKIKTAQGESIQKIIKE
jgi:uncharacterized repeat protein (TIGR02543 family)